MGKIVVISITLFLQLAGHNVLLTSLALDMMILVFFIMFIDLTVQFEDRVMTDADREEVYRTIEVCTGIELETLLKVPGNKQ